MSHSDTLPAPASIAELADPDFAQKRRLGNAIWEPFVQFKLLIYMLGSTAIVAVLLGGFLYFAFSDLIEVVTGATDGTDSYYSEMIEIQLVHLFRYCGALFVLYILLLAAVCVTYTHRLIGPFRPFSRHVDALIEGNHRHRVRLRKGDLPLYTDYAHKLNALAEKLERAESSN